MISFVKGGKESDHWPDLAQYTLTYSDWHKMSELQNVYVQLNIICHMVTVIEGEKQQIWTKLYFEFDPFSITFNFFYM